MNQVKIGKFIAERRKLAKLTQAQLAEKLNITDRAVSKWETGKSLPDASIMLELCGILKITVNELLNGEEINMKNQTKEMENKIIELVKEKEISDKRMLRLDWIVKFLTFVLCEVLFIIYLVVPMSTPWHVAILFLGVTSAMIGGFTSQRIEQVAGYYECKHCNHKYALTFNDITGSMYIGQTHYMTCPKCGKKSWQKKVINKDEIEV